ncbi:MAG: 8-amino-7-oxononanoate synthase [Thermoguttaceae bacterium]|jgi:8-amino-7-oxononanoate synthase
MDWIDEQLGILQQRGLRRCLSTRTGAQSAVIVIEGQEAINFGSNDYLNLASDTRLTAAVAAALQEYGWGSGASPLVTGYAQAHRRLEQRLAQFEGTEAALVFTSGFAANTGTVAALAAVGDVVFTDRKNHASLIDGCRLSRADVRTYPHADWQTLERLLSKSSTERDLHGARRRLIVTDGVFSMDGDLAPLKELADLARRYQAMLLVDEAHATGVFGRQGRGVAEHFGLEDLVHVRVGTLSKALGCFGGFVAGSRSLIEWLVNRARPYVFSTAMPAANAAAAMAALDIVENEPRRRVELLARADGLRAQLAAQGWNIGRSASQIIPIIVGQPSRAVALSAALREKGLFVPAIRPPTVPEGEACLRISLTCGHTEDMIAKLLEVLEANKHTDIST